MPLYIVDRFEGSEWAVLEDERARILRVPRNWLPGDAREGDVIDASVGAGTGATSILFKLNPEERAERLAEARRLRAQLPRGPKGDLEL